MAYVFGIEGVPIFEMLLIVLVLMLTGLIFILLELKKLTSLIKEEKVDITRFESDLTQFERDEGKRPSTLTKPSDKMVSYIRGAMKKGMSPAQIEATLTQRGWPKAQVDNILRTMKK